MKEKGQEESLVKFECQENNEGGGSRSEKLET